LVQIVNPSAVHQLEQGAETFLSIEEKMDGKILLQN